MTECNFVESSSYGIHMYPNLGVSLSDQQQFRLNKINEIKDYFVEEIKERELMRKRCGKYVAPFEHFDNSLFVLSVTTGNISIASFATFIEAPVGILSASFSIAFPICTGIVKKLLKTTRNKKKKHNKTVILATIIHKISETYSSFHAK